MPMHALYKGDAADAALLYKNVACNYTCAKRYRVNNPTIYKKNLSFVSENLIFNYIARSI